jgi:hypothetical protein
LVFLTFETAEQRSLQAHLLHLMSVFLLAAVVQVVLAVQHNKINSFVF